MKKRAFPTTVINLALECIGALAVDPALTRRQRIIVSQASKYLESLKPPTVRTRESEPVLTPREVAQRFHVHVVTVRSWASRGLIGHINTPGGHRRFPIADVERFARQYRC